jgi:DNA polymerase-1
MSAVAYDTETWLVEPGMVAPPLVCLSYATGTEVGLLDRHQAAAFFHGLLMTERNPIIGWRIAYDNAVMAALEPSLLEPIFEAYEAGRFTDARLRERLLSIQETGDTNAAANSLADAAKKYCGLELEKGTFQLQYRELYDVPMAEWSEGAIKYPKLDARATYDVWAAQSEQYGSEIITNEREQAAYDFALHIVSCFGIRTDPAECRRLRRATEIKIDDARKILLEAGLLKPVYKGRGKAKVPTGEFKKEQKLAQDLAERVAHAKGIELERTPTGKPQLTEEAVTLIGDPTLEAYQVFSSSSTHLTRVAEFEAGVEKPIHTRYECLLATGRTSSSKPNLQNLSRDGGHRECVVPRAGNVFFAADYSSLELHTLAQACVSLLGQSRMAEVLNEGRDAHLWMAAMIDGRTYEEYEAIKKQPHVKEARQFAKIANFGFPGGLSPQTLVVWAKVSYGVEMSIGRAEELRDQWFSTWPEMPIYFDHIKSEDGLDGIVVEQLFSGRVRGRCRFTQAANSYFQGLGADCAKSALYEVVRQQLTDEASDLYGTNAVLFVHDEIICEGEEAYAPEAALALQQVMEAAGQIWMPDCPPKAEPHLMRRWTKEAGPTFGADGRLIPWEDREERKAA